MIVAMVINIIVINTIKFFFEVLVWITPVPFVDAILEGCNKAICAGLMAVYAFSPLLATILNLIIFTICAIAFRWVYRRVTYLRRIITDPLISLVFPNYGELKETITVFPKDKFGPFPAKTRLLLSRDESGWALVQKRLLLPPVKHVISSDRSGTLTTGLFVNKIHFPEVESTPLVFSRRHNKQIDALAEKFALQKINKQPGESAAQLEIA